MKFICPVIAYFFIILSGLAQASQNQIYTVENKTVIGDPLQYTGSLVPASMNELISPANAVITKKYVNFGSKVKKDELLYELSSLELITKLNEAKLQLFENTTHLEKLKHWQNSSEVLQAQHNVNRDHQQYLHAKKHFEETKKLYEAGIVSKEEYLTDQRYNKESLHHYQHAKQQLVDVQQKGGDKFVTVAQMKVAQSKQQVEILTDKLAFMVVKAPVDGIFFAPIRQKEGKEFGALNEKTTVQEGQSLGMVADNNQLFVKIQVDEFDIANIHQGQKAQISLLAYGAKLNGKIVDINTMTNSAQNQQAANFDVKIMIDDFTPDLKPKVLLGMSCMVKLVPVSLQGLLVPKQAVVYENDDSYVKVIHDDKITLQKVVLGETTSDYVLVQGIKSGDNIVVPS